MTRENAQRRQLNEWNVAQLRFTVFPQQAAAVPTEEWWNAATGFAPENVQQDLRNALVTATGTIEQLGSLTLVHTPGRIEWIWEAGLNPLQDALALPHIGNYTEAIDRFCEWLRNWSPRCPNSVRLAFGANLRLPMEDRVASYRELCNYLNFDVDGRVSSDFLYQINRRRDWKYNGQQVHVNRLCQWSAGILLLALGNIGTTGQLLPRAEFHYVNLHLDINTDPAFQGAFDGNGLIAALDHFSTLGSEIALEGDIQ